MEAAMDASLDCVLSDLLIIETGFFKPTKVPAAHAPIK